MMWFNWLREFELDSDLISKINALVVKSIQSPSVLEVFDPN